MSTVRKGTFVESFGTPGLWFVFSYAGMPRIYDLPSAAALALICGGFPLVFYVWYRMTNSARKRGLAVIFVIGSAAYLIGLKLYLKDRVPLLGSGLAVVYWGHVMLGGWAIVRALRIGFQKGIKWNC